MAVGIDFFHVEILSGPIYKFPISESEGLFIKEEKEVSGMPGRVRIDPPTPREIATVLGLKWDLCILRGRGRGNK